MNLPSSAQVSMNYRSSKLKIFSFISLKLTITLLLQLILFLYREYMILTNITIQDLDFDLTITNDIEISLIGTLTLNSTPRKDISMTSVNVFLTTMDKEEIATDNYSLYKQGDSNLTDPLVNIYFPVSEKNTITSTNNKHAPLEVKMKLSGKLILLKEIDIIHRVQQLLDNKIHTYIIIGFVSVKIKFWKFEHEFVVRRDKRIIKDNSPSNSNIEPLTDNKVDVFINILKGKFKYVELGATGEFPNSPINLAFEGFKYFGLGFYINKKWEWFSGKLERLDIQMMKYYLEKKCSDLRDKRLCKTNCLKHNVWGLIKILHKDNMSNKEELLYKQVPNLKKLDTEKTRMIVSGRRSSNEWLDVNSRLRFLLYRYLYIDSWINS